MFRIFYRVFALFLALGITGGSLRAEEPIYSNRFEGGYLGVQLAAGQAKAKFTINNIPIFNSDVSGGVFSLYSGYGWQKDRRYLGFEFSAGYSGVTNGNLTPVGGTLWLNGEIERVYGVSLLAKAGAVVGKEKKTLVYALAGPSIVRVEARARLSGVGQVSDATPYPGLSVGAGVEHFINDRFSVRLQGVYTYYYKVDDVFRGLTVQQYDLDTAGIGFGLTRWFGR